MKIIKMKEFTSVPHSAPELLSDVVDCPFPDVKFIYIYVYILLTKPLEMMIIIGQVEEDRQQNQVVNNNPENLGAPI